ncbi:hypothetical protein [Ancylobacter polymorphus]|uniref:Uncharacterized protein n=1 Tax=Ancylobacter polymorphus TaxID=223390 RepID=A0ABU0BHP0_9HYPH|nr:hypothetical protein [Ancylobacter polymorphus]MDQ0305358.1 hypothetical protein [Ancylobacter polymorphus]
MSGNVTWEMVFALTVLVGAVAGVWWRIEGRIDKAVKTVADDASLRAQAAQAAASMAATQLAEFKLEAARTYVSKDDVQQVRDEILGAVGGVRTSLDRINERLDRVVENAAKRQPVHRP